MVDTMLKFVVVSLLIAGVFVSLFYLMHKLLVSDVYPHIRSCILLS